MLAPTPIQAATQQKQSSIAASVVALMQSDNLSEKDALKRIARERGIGKSEAYRELQREQNRLR
jgi:16S rRNA (cytidine1402-2'-O)-methyltransferase